MRRSRKGNGGLAEELRRSDTPAGPVQRNSLSALQRAARECKACDLWKNATQTVFGEGPRNATIMCGGTSIRGPSGEAVESSTAGGGHRSRRGVCHERGQAFQVGSGRTRQATD